MNYEAVKLVDEHVTAEDKDTEMFMNDVLPEFFFCVSFPNVYEHFLNKEWKPPQGQHCTVLNFNKNQFNESLYSKQKMDPDKCQL